jgi:hypothetical protein
LVCEKPAVVSAQRTAAHATSDGTFMNTPSYVSVVEKNMKYEEDSAICSPIRRITIQPNSPKSTQPEENKFAQHCTKGRKYLSC